MNIRGIFFLVVLSASLILSCEYEPEAVNFKKVDSVGIQTIQISLDKIEDTLVVARQTQITFRLDLSEEVKFNVNVFVGNDKIYEGNQKSGSFYIDAIYRENGFYPLKFEVIANSGTHSLADRLELEKILFQYKGKIIHIEKSPVQRLEITSVTQQNNGLLLTWPKYPKANLKEYIIYKAVYPGYGGYSEFSQFHITDINQTSLLDSIYLGGRAEYRLHTVTLANEEAYSDIYKFQVDRCAIKSFKTTGVNTIEVKWTKSQFPFAFDSYQLSPESGYYYGNGYFTSSNINDTVSTIKTFPFGRSVRLDLRTRPKGYDAYMDGGGTYSTFQDVYLGNKIPDFQTVMPVQNANRIYYYRDGYVYVMLNSDVKPYDSIAIKLNIAQLNTPAVAQSPDGKFLYVCSDSKLVRLDPITLKEISFVSMESVLNDIGVYPFSLIVNNDHRIVVDIKRQSLYDYSVYFSDFVAIIDGETFSTLEKIDNSYNVSSIHGSSNGRYIYTYTYGLNEIFEISDEGKVVRKGVISRNLMETPVFTDTELYVINILDTKVYSLHDFLQSTSFSHPQFSSLPIIDPLTGYMGVSLSQTEFLIAEPLSMKTVQTIKTNDYTDSNDIQFINGHLMSKRGYRLTIR
jgi:hypothetical protein